jgi:threonine dehydrogenase-like Zn-dependent dehydrogenase
MTMRRSRSRPSAAAALSALALLGLPLLANAVTVSAKVGIVGAGIAGIRAASILEAAGVDYVVLEASDRVGGRMRQAEIQPYGGANLGSNKEVGVAAAALCDGHDVDVALAVPSRDVQPCKRNGLSRTSQPHACHNCCI